MKYIFIASFCLLLVASAFTAHIRPEASHDVPLLYWVTDANPARDEQISIFQKWMAKNHPDQHFDLKVDSANSDPTKRIIQSVSGVAGDVMDNWTGVDVRFFHAMGALRDLTPDATRMGFGLEKTYPAVASELAVAEPDGTLKQYAFPCNVNASMLFVNREVFRKYGVAVPPRSWSFEEFERIGKQLVAAANPDPLRRMVFMVDALPNDAMRRSLGISEFNETGTRCVLDRPENVKVLSLIYKWTRVDHLLPTTTEKNSVATDAGYGGATPQLFNSGNYALMYTGRYLLIQFRKFDEARKARGEPLMDLAVSEVPNGGFPNSVIATRCAAVYAAGPHQDLALDFMQFLASEDYNMQVVRDADALPPNPLYTRNEAYRHPPDHPNEWGVHEAFADAAEKLAAGYSYSPFVLYNTASRIDNDVFESFMNDRYGAEEAARQAAVQINTEIRRTLYENPKMQARYDSLVERQKKIEELRAAGKKVPLAWITDAFYRKYYQAMGWAE